MTRVPIRALSDCFGDRVAAGILPIPRGALERHRAVHRRYTGVICTSSARRAEVVLTREKGKNGALAQLLDKSEITWLELPLIESAPGPDRHKLVEKLRDEKFEWVVITSPEAAAVFIEGWQKAERPRVQIAVVGEGSGRIIEKENAAELLKIKFTPSKANAVHLSAELPLESTSGSTVLYPSSAKAGTDLQSGLELRGCTVVRLNTYDTVPVSDLDNDLLEAAKAAQVIAVASPSAVKAWVKFAGNQDETDVAFACIGSTSARAAEKLGLKRVFFPDAPGLTGFLKAIEEALESSKQTL